MTGDRVLTDEPSYARIVPSLVVVVETCRGTVGHTRELEHLTSSGCSVVLAVRLVAGCEYYIPVSVGD